MSHSVYSFTHREHNSVAVYRDILVFLAHENDLIGTQFMKNVCKMYRGLNSFFYLSKKSENSDKLENLFSTSIIDVHLMGNASDM